MKRILIIGNFSKIRNRIGLSDYFFECVPKQLFEKSVSIKAIFSAKLFKHLTLIFTSLLVVALSFNFTRLCDCTSSIQNKTVSYQLAILPVDDIDDDLADPEFQAFACDHAPFNSPPHSALAKGSIEGFCYTGSSVPFYIQVRNLRI